MGDVGMLFCYVLNQSHGGFWERVHVATYHANVDRWYVEGEFGPLLLSGGNKPDVDRARNILDFARTAGHGFLNGFGPDVRRSYVRYAARTGPRVVVYAFGESAVNRLPVTVSLVAELIRGAEEDVPSSDNPLPTAANPFTEYFRLAEKGHSGDILVGKVYADGTCHAATRKSIDTASKGKRAHAFKTLEWLRMNVRSAHILRVLHVDRECPLRLGVFSPWCAGGNLAQGVRGRLSRTERSEVLIGAWRGLSELNRRHGLLHFDVKPQNIFVRIARGRKCVGVLGDIDGVLRRSQCNVGSNYTFTRCYGSPFHLCDPRRDQVAMLVTTLSVLTDIDWWRNCVEKIKPLGESVLRRWGFASSGDSELPGDWDRWVPGVYDAYGARLRAAGADAAPDGPLADPVWMRLLTLLDGPSSAYRNEWDYGSVHTAATKALKGLATTRDDGSSS